MKTTKTTIVAKPENKRILGACDSLTAQEAPSYEDTVIVDLRKGTCIAGGIALTFEQARDLAYSLLSIISDEMQDAEYESGAIAGYEAGFQEGFAEATEAAYNEAYTAAYDRAYDEGFADGRNYVTDYGLGYGEDEVA